MDTNKLVVSTYNAVNVDGDMQMGFMLDMPDEVVKVMTGLIEGRQWRKSHSILVQELDFASRVADPAIDQSWEAVCEFGNRFVTWVCLKVEEQEKSQVWCWSAGMKRRIQAMASQIDQVRMEVLDNLWDFMDVDETRLMMSLGRSLEGVLDMIDEMLLDPGVCLVDTRILAEVHNLYVITNKMSAYENAIS